MCDTKNNTDKINISLSADRIRQLTLEFYSHFACIDLSTVKSGVSFVCSSARDEIIAGFGCKYTIYILDLGSGNAVAAYSPKHRGFFDSLGEVTSEEMIEAAQKQFRLRKMRLLIFGGEKVSNFDGARLLESADYPIYESFFRETEPDADPEGWLKEYFFEKTERALFTGCFDDGRLVAVCDAPDVPYMQGKVQHTGIMTLEERRGQGFGKRAAALSAKHLIETGVCPQWESDFGNVASYRLALSIGYRDFGTAYILEEY